MKTERQIAANDVSTEKIQGRILAIRGVQVMLDRDLAELYGVPVKRLNEQVSRNIERFLAGFMFQLSATDADVTTFNAQYPKLAVRYNESFHDRFLIVDDKELYLIGASLKDLGSKCFRLRREATADRSPSRSWTRAKSGESKRWRSRRVQE